MAVKITENALREFVRNMLLEEAGDDAPEEETNPSVVSSIPMDKPDTPLEADPQVIDNDLGPPTADPSYIPDGMPELKAAIGKLLDDVPEKSVGTAYKIVKKSLDNLHSVLRQRAELSPGVPVVIPGSFEPGDPISTDETSSELSLSESTNLEKLIFLISEAWNERGRVSMDSPLVKGLAAFDDPSRGVEFAGEKEEEEEEVEVRAATYGDDRKVSPPPAKEADPVDDKSQFDRFFKKKMEDMLALAKARYPEKLQGVADWNSVDDNLEPEEHLAVMDDYDAQLDKKYPVLAKSTGKDFEPPVKATLVAAVEEFMKSDAMTSTEVSDDVSADDKTDDRFTRAGALEQIPLGKKSSQDQATKEAIRRELYRMSIGTKDYFQGLIDILRKPEALGDKKLQKALDVALSDFSEEESVPESDADYFLFITYINQDLRPDPKANYRNTVLARAAEHMMSRAGFAGSKGKAERPHINKDSTLANLKASIAGIKDRSDRADADRLEKLSDILNKMLPKGETVPVVNIRDVEGDEEVEEKPVITLSPGGKTFRRKRPESTEAEMAESMTPAEAILRSTAVNPDLDKALALVKGLM